MTIDVSVLPEAIREQVQEDIVKRGEWHVSHMLHLAPIGRMLSDLKASDTDICWRVTVLHVLATLASPDPSPVHFTLSREVLNKENISDDRAVDFLARELVVATRGLKDFVLKSDCPSETEAFSVLLDTNGGGLYFPGQYFVPEIICELEGCNEFDLKAAEFFSKIGDAGKKASNWIVNTAQNRFKDYKDSGYAETHRPGAWSLWIAETSSVFMPILTALTEVIWKDRLERRWNRESKQFPACPIRLMTKIIKPLTSATNKKQIIKQDNQVMCCDQRGEPLFYAPTIDPKMISMLQSAVKSSSSLTGHKLIRWLIKTGFEQWCRKEDDPRAIDITGGYGQIAELAGCTSPRAIAEVRGILEMQAFGQFVFPDGRRGNMIILTVLGRNRNTEPSEIRIILGDMLFPGFVHQMKKHDCRRLIPIGDLPNLQGSKNTHAFQAQLQFLVFEEFSNQSDRLAEVGSAFIPINRWKEMADESGLNSDRVADVVRHWCEPDLLRCFLEKHGDEYRLASYYERAHRFLIDQGQQRLIGSRKGKASSQKRKKM